MELGAIVYLEFERNGGKPNIEKTIFSGKKKKIFAKYLY